MSCVLALPGRVIRVHGILGTAKPSTDLRALAEESEDLPARPVEASLPLSGKVPASLFLEGRVCA